LNNFDEKLRELLFDAEMPVSPNVWDKIEARIETKPERPKYWLVFMVVSLAIPAMLLFNYTNSDAVDTVTMNESRTIDTQVNLKSDKTIKNMQKQLISADVNQTEEFTETTTTSIFQKSSSTISLAQNSINNKRINTPLLTKPVVNLKTTVDKNVSEASEMNSVLLKFGKLKDVQSLNQNRKVARIQSSSELPIIDKLFATKTKCPTFSRKLKGIYAWSDYTSSYPIQSLSNATSDIQPLINKRSESEKSMYSFSTGVGLGYISPTGFLIETGIVYNQVNIKFNIVEEDIIGHTRVTYENVDGTIDSVDLIPHIGLTEIQHTNKFKQFDIPVQVGYEMPILPNLRINVKAGVNVNLSSNSYGRILGANGDPFFYGHDSNEPSLYKSKFGIGYLGGVNLLTDLSDKLSIRAGLNMKYYNNINNKENVIYQSITQVGLSAGLRYRFQ